MYICYINVIFEIISAHLSRGKFQVENQYGRNQEKMLHRETGEYVIEIESSSSGFVSDIRDPIFVTLSKTISNVFRVWMTIDDRNLIEDFGLAYITYLLFVIFVVVGVVVVGVVGASRSLQSRHNLHTISSKHSQSLITCLIFQFIGNSDVTVLQF